MHNDYIKQGISCVYVDANKRAIRPWKIYQSQLASPHELEAMHDDPKAYGIAVICGAISGGLEIIDIDAKYDLSGTIFDDYITMLPDDLAAKLYIVTTVNKGYHIYYRCAEISGNLKLAQRHTTPDELRLNPHDKVRVLIETRGEGGYCVAPPTPGYDTTYHVDIPTITTQEREMLFEAARSFNQIKEEVRESKSATTDSYAISPFDDYNKRGIDDMLQRLFDTGWKEVRRTAQKVILLRPGATDSKSSGDFNYDLNWFSVFSTSTQFEPNKAYRPAAVFCMLECGGDWKQAARRLSDMGYGEQRRSIDSKIRRDVFRKKEEGTAPDDIAAFVASKYAMKMADASEVVTQLDKQWGERICTFWEVSDKGHITIVRTKMQEFLSGTGGFYIYYYDMKSPIFKMVRIIDGFVEEVTTEHIKKYIKEYINELPDSFDGITPAALLEVIYKGSDTYFSKSLLEFMPRVNLNLLKDDKDTAFFPFRNGVVKVTKSKISLLNYGELGLHVWRNQVVQFNIDIDETFDEKHVEFLDFILKISNDDSVRANYVISLIGYCLHKYKDQTRPFALILAEETEKEKEGGGTGKGIFFKAISKLLNVVFVDGKNFKLDKSFAFQRINLDTQLVVIEDCRKNVDFEGFYSNITEGVTVEKKNKDELYIGYADAPKFGFTTNYSIQLNGNHAKRRAKVIEFSNYFNPRRTPLDYFGHALFDGWDDDEWNRFYNLMLHFVQIYLTDGIPEAYTSETLRRKTIKLTWGEEFCDYYDELERGKWYGFTDEYTGFLKAADFERKDYSNKRFRAALEAASDAYGHRFEVRKNRQDSNRKEFVINVTD